jgi:hypothetical protein
MAQRMSHHESGMYHHGVLIEEVCNGIKKHHYAQEDILLYNQRMPHGRVISALSLAV